MLNWLRNFLISDDDNDPAFVRLLRNILIVIFVILILLAITQTSFFTNVFSGIPDRDAAITLAVIAIATGYLIYLANKKILWPSKLFLPTALVVSITYFTATENGLHDVTMIGFPAVIFTASLLIGRKSLLFWAIVTSACVGFIGYWDIAGLTPEPVARTTGIDTVAMGIILVFATTGIAWLQLQRLEENITAARKNENEQIQANQELRSLQSNLEVLIEERTNELAQRSIELETANQSNQQRAAQFEAIAQVANAIASIRTLKELLPKITQYISEKFNFYHIGIFLNDASNQYAILSAANSEGGQRMLARRHQLKIGEQGIVGSVASTGAPRIALDVGEDATFFNNPDLPNTHSEMALPLTISGKTVGVLDVQSTEPEAFDQDDLQILSILADQVSLAIENARLFEESSKSITEAEALYRQYLRQ
ncbi:MAG: GAF domain-containing protein, partial [Anaerolineales bacterium]